MNAVTNFDISCYVKDGPQLVQLPVHHHRLQKQKQRQLKKQEEKKAQQQRELLLQPPTPPEMIGVDLPIVDSSGDDPWTIPIEELFEPYPSSAVSPFDEYVDYKGLSGNTAFDEDIEGLFEQMDNEGEKDGGGGEFSSSVSSSSYDLPLSIFS